MPPIIPVPQTPQFSAQPQQARVINDVPQGLSASPYAGMQRAIGTLYDLMGQKRKMDQEDRQEALQRAMNQILLAENGLPVNAKAIEKDLKKAGVNLDWSLGGQMSQQIQQMRQQQPQGIQDQTVSRQPNTGMGTQMYPDVNLNPQAGQPQMGNTVLSAQARLDQMARVKQAQTNVLLQNLQSEQQKLSMLQQARNGDYDALMKLSFVGDVPAMNEVSTLFAVQSRMGVPAEQILHDIAENMTLKYENVKQQMKLRVKEANEETMQRTMKMFNDTMNTFPLADPKTAWSYAEMQVFGRPDSVNAQQWNDYKQTLWQNITNTPTVGKLDKDKTKFTQDRQLASEEIARSNAALGWANLKYRQQRDAKSDEEYAETSNLAERRHMLNLFRAAEGLWDDNQKAQTMVQLMQDSGLNMQWVDKRKHWYSLKPDESRLTLGQSPEAEDIIGQSSGTQNNVDKEIAKLPLEVQQQWKQFLRATSPEVQAQAQILGGHAPQIDISQLPPQLQEIYRKYIMQQSGGLAGGINRSLENAPIIF